MSTMSSRRKSRIIESLLSTDFVVLLRNENNQLVKVSLDVNDSREEVQRFNFQIIEGMEDLVKYWISSSSLITDASFLFNNDEYINYQSMSLDNLGFSPFPDSLHNPLFDNRNNQTTVKIKVIRDVEDFIVRDYSDGRTIRQYITADNFVIESNLQPVKYIGRDQSNDQSFNEQDDRSGQSDQKSNRSFLIGEDSFLEQNNDHLVYSCRTYRIDELFSKKLFNDPNYVDDMDEEKSSQLGFCKFRTINDPNISMGNAHPRLSSSMSRFHFSLEKLGSRVRSVLSSFVNFVVMENGQVYELVDHIIPYLRLTTMTNVKRVFILQDGQSELIIHYNKDGQLHKIDDYSTDTLIFPIELKENRASYLRRQIIETNKNCDINYRQFKDIDAHDDDDSCNESLDGLGYLNCYGPFVDVRQSSRSTLSLLNSDNSVIIVDLETINQGSIKQMIVGPFRLI